MYLPVHQTYLYRSRLILLSDFCEFLCELPSFSLKVRSTLVLFNSCVWSFWAVVCLANSVLCCFYHCVKFLLDDHLVAILCVLSILFFTCLAPTLSVLCMLYLCITCLAATLLVLCLLYVTCFYACLTVTLDPEIISSRLICSVHCLLFSTSYSILSMVFLSKTICNYC